MSFPTGLPLQLRPVVKNWMKKPDVTTTLPGLEYLVNVNQLLVHRSHKVYERCSQSSDGDCTLKYSFDVKDWLGEQCYAGHEERMSSERKYIMCAAGGFTMHVTDSRNVEVIRVESASRLLSRDCCWAKLDPCLHYARIEAPVGNVIGQVKQTMPGCFSRYVVLDSYQHKIFTIQRESSNFSLFNFNFVIKTNDGNTVGGITRKWSGLPEDVFSNARKFSVTFPQDLEVKMKAVLLGALFLINSVHFGEDDE